MQTDYYGIKIAPMSVETGWKWQVALPINVVITSNFQYETPETAVNQGQQWLNAESAFIALNTCLLELCSQGLVQHQEYGALMHSILKTTRHR